MPNFGSWRPLFRMVLYGCVALSIALAGCSAIAPSEPTATPDQSPVASSTPHESPRDTGPTPGPTGGLLIVDPGANATADLDRISYNATRFDDAPVLNRTITAAAAANASRTEGLSPAELARMQTMLDRSYPNASGHFVVVVQNTPVRVSIAVEV